MILEGLFGCCLFVSVFSSSSSERKGREEKGALIEKWKRNKNGNEEGMNWGKWYGWRRVIYRKRGKRQRWVGMVYWFFPTDFPNA